MVEYSKIHGKEPYRMCIENGYRQKMKVQSGYGVGEEKVQAVQFNKGRPPVNRNERRGAKRNLFGEGEKKTSGSLRLNLG